MFDETVRKKRVTNNSVAEARRVVTPTLSLFGPWRGAVALMSAARSGAGDHERAAMSVRCGTIRVEIQLARNELTERVRALPPKAASSTRVTDVLRALDSIEATLDDLDERMGH